MQKGYAHILLARNLVSAFLAPYLFLLLQMGTDLQASVTYLALVVIIISFSSLLVIVVCVCLVSACGLLCILFPFASLSSFVSLFLCDVGSSTAPAVLHILVPVLESPRVTLLGDQLSFVQLTECV